MDATDFHWMNKTNSSKENDIFQNIFFSVAQKIKPYTEGLEMT